jgi:hypothetical protein
MQPIFNLALLSCLLNKVLPSSVARIYFTLIKFTIKTVRMWAFISLGLTGLLFSWLFAKVAALNRNIAAAKSSGLPYRISSKLLFLSCVEHI